MSTGIRLEEDAAGQRAVARLRLFSALMAVTLGGAIAALGPGPLGWIVSGLAILAGIIWFRLYFRARRHGFRGGGTLAIDDSGLHMALLGENTRIEWPEVLETEVDEDRLLIRVHRREGPPLDIPPVFRGMGLHELAQVIERYHREAEPSSVAPEPEAR